MKFKIKKIVKFAIVSLLFIGIATYIVIAMTSMTSSDPEELCSELSLKIKENPKANFIDVRDLTGRMQVYVKIDEIGEENFADFKKLTYGLRQVSSPPPGAGDLGGG